MSNFLNKILSDGFVKGEENILDKNDLNSLLTNIEALISKQIRENKASPFLPLRSFFFRICCMLLHDKKTPKKTFET